MPFTVEAADDGLATPEEQVTAYQAALLRERDGYIRRGDAKRVDQVEAELVRTGFSQESDDAEQATEAEPDDAEQATPRRRRK